MNEKHSPAPWTADLDLGEVHDADGKNIADVWWHNAKSRKQGEATLLLMAAAPDLLAACERIMAEEFKPMADTRRALRAAVAKAKGQEPQP